MGEGGGGGHHTCVAAHSSTAAANTQSASRLSMRALVSDGARCVQPPAAFLLAVKSTRLRTFIEIRSVMSPADFSVNILHHKCFSFLLPDSHFQTRAHTHTHLHPQVFPLFFPPPRSLSPSLSFQPCGAVSLCSLTRAEGRKAQVQLLVLFLHLPI